MYMRDTVYDAVKILVKISRDFQNKSQEQKSFISPMSWMKEYCTVRASTSRRGGHTTTVIKLMSENDMNIGYLTKTRKMIKEFQCLYSYEMSDCGSLEFCETFDYCCGESGTKFRGKKFSYLDAIVVDISCMLSKVQEKEIYRLALDLQRLRDYYSAPFFLIFLQ